MASMYETIRDLPLFKGIGDDQLSSLLEKTSIEFDKFEDGEIVNESSSQVKNVEIILSGRVRQTYQLTNFPIAVDEILGKGGMPGIIHLFGMDTTYTSTGTALGKVSVMRIDKSQYMNVLQSDKIYLLNFVNHISAAAQKPQEQFIRIKEASIRRTLETLAFTLASRQSETVMVAADDKALAEYCGVSEEEFKNWKTWELSHKRIIATQRGIFLKSSHLEK